MNTIVILLALFVATMAAPQQLYRYIPVLSRVETRDDAGQFFFRYQSGDGTVVSEQGFLRRTPDGLDNVLVKRGAYSYTSPEGVPVQVTYIADENGFHPISSSIPLAPTVPQPTF